MPPVTRARPLALLPALIVATLVFGVAAPAAAQFRNNSFQFELGGMGYGTTMDVLLRPIGAQWVITDQITLSAGGMRMISDNIWYDGDATVGVGQGIANGAGFAGVFSASTSQGIRYNFLDEKHRPFVAGHLVINSLFAPFELAAPPPVNTILGQSLWIGARLGGGYEYYFMDEISVQGEVNAVAFVDIPPKLSWTSRLGINIYF